MKRQWMRSAIATLSLVFLTAASSYGDDGIETIVFIRHGEKPDAGLGQLNCKGLNRALALPQVIAKSFGTPTIIFAPDPSERKLDDGEPYDYVRPLATIEPTAIFFGLPVDTSIGVSATDRLQTKLEDPAHHKDLVLVAWEHKLIEKVARSMLAAHSGDPSVVPKWHGGDFDSIYVVTMAWTGTLAKTTFSQLHEGLDGQPDNCLLH